MKLSTQIAVVLSVAMFVSPATSIAQTLVTTISLPSTGGSLSLDPASNLLYTGGSNPGAEPVDVVNGYTFAVAQPAISGNGVATDRLNDNFWVPGIYSGTVQVYNANNSLLDTITLGYCPITAQYDQKHKQVWVGAQCGALNDPVWAINSTTFVIKAGPIGLGAVFGGLIVDPPTGVAYVTENGCKRVDPVTYAVTTAPFSPNCPSAADPVSGYLYVFSGSTLQIWNGNKNPETLVKSVTLAYMPSHIAENDALGHLYIGESGTTTLDIRNSANGAEIAQFADSSLVGLGDGTLTADSTRGRVYANASTSSGRVLYVIDDLSTSRRLGTRGY